MADETLREPVRLRSLDAVRGLAVLAMALSGWVPDKLPNWMYHGYHPRFLPVAGGEAGGAWEAVANPWAFRGGWASFTWVDLVFPLFLFAMGAAIPLAIAARRRRGATAVGIVGQALGRFFLLVLVAVVLGQFRPAFHAAAWGDGPAADRVAQWVAILGAAVLTPLLLVLPRTVSPGVRFGLRSAGLALVALVLAAVNDARGEPFSWENRDIILLLLAWASLVATLLALATPGRPGLRLGLGLTVGVVAQQLAFGPADAGLRFTGPLLEPLRPVAGFVRGCLDLRGVNGLLPGSLPEGWLDLRPLFDFTWLKYLIPVAIGTLIGEALAEPAERRPGGGWFRRAAVTLGAAAAVLGSLAGLADYAGAVPLPGVSLPRPWAAAPLFAVGAAVAWAGLLWKNPPAGRNPRTTLLLRHGTAWSAVGIGLALLPLGGPGAAASGEGFASAGFFEGGIAKGPPATLAWLVLSSGLSVLLVAASSPWLDAARGRGWNGPLVLVGRNPLLAYAAIPLFAGPLFALPLLVPLLPATPSIGETLVAVFAGSPWRLVGAAAVKVALLAAAVALLTRWRIVWRA